MTLLIICVIALAMAALTIVSMWILFTKAKEQGWKAIIPIYNMVTMCQIIGINPLWIAIVFGAAIIGQIPLFVLVFIVVNIYFSVIYNVSIAKSYGKSDSFAVGLILLPGIFLPILAFGKNEYLGPKPMDDIIFKNNTNNMNSQNVTNNNVTNANIICSNCNSQVQQGAAFCTNCGTKI